jgi:hypothetical protein
MYYLASLIEHSFQIKYSWQHVDYLTKKSKFDFRNSDYLPKNL